ncbi:hypothetical protein H8R17_07860 [Streptomyces sp. TRM68367]|nr:hypothetical protein [Streptomyces sp. TRM68367]MBC9724881.1 hypothetical protein [Streptomyces sp. TRM68367]
MPDQQADTARDRWEGSTDRADRAADEHEAAAADVPDTDQAGTGREGSPQSASVHPEQPVPDEPSE